MKNERIFDLLLNIYGQAKSESVHQDLNAVLDEYRGQNPRPHQTGLSERDAILIAYPDQVQEPAKLPLASLADFCNEHLRGVISGIHVLPFYPSSSDDGFSVIDYEAVAPQYGDWKDVRRLGEHFRLMFDAVINHASAQSRWLRGTLQGEPAYRDYFIEVTGQPDLSGVVRPRALPLLTSFKSADGEKRLWTTFSADQVDLNYRNPEVLKKILEVLLFYASQGADFIRLDAIAYLWKEIGTSCISLPQTHWMVQLMRAVLDAAAPHVMLITETNVPNQENLSYFGNGSNEAQLAYNFPLPPLVLHALWKGDAGILSEWAASLHLPSSNVTFLNFLASHDGIGLNPVRGLLPENEIAALRREIVTRGGFVSTKTEPNGTESPYELNINYFDALNSGNPGDAPDTQVDRFVCAHTILLAFRGVPAIYFHSLFGSRGWPEGARQSGMYRTINREKLQIANLQGEISNPASLRARVFGRLSHLLRKRAENACFSPVGSQRVLESKRSIFALVREAESTDKAVCCIHNVSATRQTAEVRLADTALAGTLELRELISGRKLAGGTTISLELAPYESAWLTN